MSFLDLAEDSTWYLKHLGPFSGKSHTSLLMAGLIFVDNKGAATGLGENDHWQSVFFHGGQWWLYDDLIDNKSRCCRLMCLETSRRQAAILGVTTCTLNVSMQLLNALECAGGPCWWCSKQWYHTPCNTRKELSCKLGTSVHACLRAVACCSTPQNQRQKNVGLNLGWNHDCATLIWWATEGSVLYGKVIELMKNGKWAKICVRKHARLEWICVKSHACLVVNLCGKARASWGKKT